MSSESLASSSFADRAAAVAEAEANAQAECVAAVAALNNEIHAAWDLAAQKKAAAAKAAADTHDELDAEIAADTLAALEPLARAYPNEPRAKASRIASIWRDLQTRAREEVGTEIHCSHLAIAFANAAGFADKFGHTAAFHSGGEFGTLNAADKVSRAILAGAYDPVVDDALRELEIAVVTQAQMWRYPDAERAKAKHSRATIAGMKEQEQRVDAERAAAAPRPSMSPHVKVL